MLRNKFLSICNSHRILVAMMMTIESGKDIFVLFFYISKCIWWPGHHTRRIVLSLNSNPCGFIHKNYNGAPVRAEVSHLYSLKEGVGNKFLTPSLAQWLNGMSYTVNSLLIPIQLCGGKKTKHSRYNVVSRVFLSFSLVLMRFPITVIMESA